MENEKLIAIKDEAKGQCYIKFRGEIGEIVNFSTTTIGIDKEKLKKLDINTDISINIKTHCSIQFFEKAILAPWDSPDFMDSTEDIKKEVAKTYRLNIDNLRIVEIHRITISAR